MTYLPIWQAVKTIPHLAGEESTEPQCFLRNFQPRLFKPRSKIRKHLGLEHFFYTGLVKYFKFKTSPSIGTGGFRCYGTH